MSFLTSLPIYLFAYIGIIQSLRTNFRKYSWILFLFITMLLFSVIFYTQNRFRTITLEPVYILFAVFGFFSFLKNNKYFKMINLEKYIN